MTKKTILALVALLILLGVGAYFVIKSREAVISPDTNNGSNGDGNNGATTTPPASNALIRVTTPAPNALVSSPLTITGEARGNWYFEASFPVKILDANGKVLGQYHAEAQGDWMTTNFVPFRSILSFATSTTPTGTLVLEKDNPSGLPANAAEIRIPVRFSTQTPSERTIKLYFYNENKDKDASGNIRCSAQGLVALNRNLPLTNTPIQDAIKELLKGPTAAERAQVPGTEFPLAGVNLTAASLSNGVLTLFLSDPQGKIGGGSCRVLVLRAQFEATAKQFSGVNTVKFSPDLFQP